MVIVGLPFLEMVRDVVPAWIWGGILEVNDDELQGEDKPGRMDYDSYRLTLTL